jgi:hypothetical protein
LRLLIQYIHTYRPYLDAVSSILDPRTCHALVTVTITWPPLDFVWNNKIWKIKRWNTLCFYLLSFH